MAYTPAQLNAIKAEIAMAIMIKGWSSSLSPSSWGRTARALQWIKWAREYDTEAFVKVMLEQTHPNTAMLMDPNLEGKAFVTSFLNNMQECMEYLNKTQIPPLTLWRTGPFTPHWFMRQMM